MREADDLTTFMGTNVMKIREPKAPGTLWATPGLLRDCFTFNSRVFCVRRQYRRQRDSALRKFKFQNNIPFTDVITCIYIYACVCVCVDRARRQVFAHLYYDAVRGPWNLMLWNAVRFQRIQGCVAMCTTEGTVWQFHLIQQFLL